MNSIASIESAAGVNHHFTDSGLFGLKVSGYYKDSKQLLETVIKELKLLTQQIETEEFYRGMNILNSQIQLNLERQADRLEEQVKNMFTFNRLASPYYHESISAVTIQEAQNIVQDIILNQLPVVIYKGKGASQLPDMEQVLTMLRK